MSDYENFHHYDEGYAAGQKEAAHRIAALEEERDRLRRGIEKAAERLEASRFTNAEHRQAADILRAALAGGE